MAEYTSIYKTVTVIALSLPVLYGVVYYMVEARMGSLERRLILQENLSAQGARFTRADGDNLHRHIESLSREITAVRHDQQGIATIGTECKATLGGMNYRLNRLEDRYYSDREAKGKNGFKDAPYETDPELVDPMWYAKNWR